MAPFLRAGHILRLLLRIGGITMLNAVFDSGPDSPGSGRPIAHADRFPRMTATGIWRARTDRLPSIPDSGRPIAHADLYPRMTATGIWRARADRLPSIPDQSTVQPFSLDW